LSRGSDCASARPNQASATNEQTILVHIQIADFIGHLVSFRFGASNRLGRIASRFFFLISDRE
jgi:hypothetical protein